MLLVLSVLVGCSDEPVLVESSEDLKGVKVKKIIWEKDGSEMMLIPAGSFEMGDHFNEAYVDELPVHTVTLDAFYMDTHEVTVGQFREFVNQSGYQWEGEWTTIWDSVAKYSPGDDYPIVYVDWNNAMAYAEWAGKRLPTEAEWEYAARGGVAGKRYPWGNEITHDDANYSGTGGKDVWEGGSNGGTAPVGSFAANGYGLYDMAGNVWEWCQDWYDENYYSVSPAKNPSGPSTGFETDERRVKRGGSWDSSPFAPTPLRLAIRGYGSQGRRTYSCGFRCVSGLP